MRYLSSLKPSALRGKICVLRLDFNTEDNWRLEASVPTLTLLTAHCKAVVIVSHKGRPVGYDKAFSLQPITRVLSKNIGHQVTFIPHFHFKEAQELIQSSPQGSVFLMENLRFLDGEAQNSDILAEHLASLGDFYVNDAFAVSHRSNASVAAITKFLDSYAGLELEAELENLTKVMKKSKKPLIVILGGLKIEDKLGVVENLQDRASVFLVGGALTPALLLKLEMNSKIKPAIDFKKNLSGAIRDIGPETVKLFKQDIARARTIIWNGPMGDIKDKKFEAGTEALGRAIAANKTAFKVIGGGETVMYMKHLKLDKKIDFVSTGGGAMLDFLAGKKLPGIEALE